MKTQQKPMIKLTYRKQTLTEAQRVRTIAFCTLVDAVERVCSFSSIGVYARPERQVVDGVGDVHHRLAEEHVDQIRVRVTRHVEVARDLYQRTNGEPACFEVTKDDTQLAFLTCIQPCTLHPSPFCSSGLPPSVHRIRKERKQSS